MLRGKNIVIGVTGGIAVYKAVDVVSRLKKLGAEINVIMTKSATEFVTPLTFQSLSQNYVVTDMFEEPKTWDVEHIALAQKADLFLLVPATANVIGKIAYGIADDMLTTTVMATKANVVIAPAMNTGMYTNPIVGENIEKLTHRGYKFIEPDSGRLACGDIGVGKLAQPERIVDVVVEEKIRKKDLEGKKILVTAGPTQESVDPVRYITNHSTGKMGYAIAEAALKRGADVTLITGKTNLAVSERIKLVPVVTAIEMYDAVLANYEDADVIIKAAAVADYRPKVQTQQKIKKTGDDMVIELTRNPDIALEIGKVKGDRVFVGFAAETNDLIENAMTKINKKNFDMIVANDITAKDAGFGKDTNVVTLIHSNGKQEPLEKMSKGQVANVILDKIKLIVDA